MSSQPRYLIDELQTADMLEVDGLHAWQFTLNDELLDRAETAANAGDPFASDEIVVRIESIDGRERRRWSFSYNSVMEAQLSEDAQCWLIADASQARLRCLGATIGSTDDE